MSEVRADISALKTEVGSLKESMSEVRADISALKTEVGSLKESMSEVRADVSALQESDKESKTEIKALKEEMAEMRMEINDLKETVKRIELTLENETNRNIRIIAEGHLELSRKLDAVLQVENEKELLLVRVNTLESEVRKIKENMQTA
ncbi:MAG TPA: hypothetical protein H9717_14125 [Candidatus Eisenbergiella merdipullorum]|uniref:Uncharacterized protein n=1 Tax=Candidatus Eisenbergiella merdipullorum TaxID=2838553 RepID=A0A9D2I988_9FIRM|nr:hypothetical protein [Candidatus Eisenbergiella merdipullorum]